MKDEVNYYPPLTCCLVQPSTPPSLLFISIKPPLKLINPSLYLPIQTQIDEVPVMN